MLGRKLYSHACGVVFIVEIIFYLVATEILKASVQLVVIAKKLKQWSSLNFVIV